VNGRKRRLGGAFLIACSLVRAAPLVAGEASLFVTPPSVEALPPRSVPSWSFDVNADYTVGSPLRHLETLSSQAVGHYEVEALRRFEIAGSWYLRCGLDVERFDFSRSNAVFPSSLNSVAGELALEYWHGEDIGILIKLSPGVYYARDHITANSFDIPIQAGSGIQITKDFSLAIGLTAGLLRPDPILPVGGFVWNVSNGLKVSAIFPEPRVTYKSSAQWEWFVGGEYAGGGYRNGPTNDRRTNQAALTYTEVRAGAGVTYTPRKGVSLEGTVGWTFEREINYFHSGPEFSTRTGAPYFKLDVSVDLF